MCEFSRKSSFFPQAKYNIKTEKQTIHLLSLCQFDAGMLAEGQNVGSQLCFRFVCLIILSRNL